MRTTRPHNLLCRSEAVCFFPLGAPQQSPEKFPVALVEAFFYLLLGTSIVQVDFVQNYFTSHETIQIDFSFQ